MSDVGPPRDQRELEAVAAIAAQCFNVPAEDLPAWLARAGERNVRVLRERGAVCAALLIIPMGQWFGGRSVPMGGIAAVGVPPERRGAGHALALTRAALAEMAAGSLLLSTLYPATTQLYRQAGYELAGGRFEARITLRQVGLRERELPVRPLTSEDLPAVSRAARCRAAASPGHLDRGDYIWQRIREPRGKTVRGYGVEREGRLDGYLYLHQTAAEGPGHYDLQLTDIVALSPPAGRRLLTFLADHGSLADTAVLHLGPADPLLALLPERCSSLRLVDPWMLRVLDVAGALSARGWPAAARGELRLDVRDELLPANHGGFRLVVEGGRAEVSRVPPGDPSALRLGVRGLAPLYTGHMSPSDLVLAGLLDGPPESLQLAASLFAGRGPVMPDMF